MEAGLVALGVGEHYQGLDHDKEEQGGEQNGHESGTASLEVRAHE
ncbi:MAG: hypothetical protein AMXMBFR33_70470 [Candidatus Xenobia bacterium]